MAKKKGTFRVTKRSKRSKRNYRGGVLTPLDKSILMTYLNTISKCLFQLIEGIDNTDWDRKYQPLLNKYEEMYSLVTSENITEFNVSTVRSKSVVKDYYECAKMLARVDEKKSWW